MFLYAISFNEKRIFYFARKHLLFPITSLVHLITHIIRIKSENDMNDYKVLRYRKIPMKL